MAQLQQDDGDVGAIRARKRPRNPSNWKRNIIKTKRVKGEAYEKLDGTVVDARRTLSLCRCSRKCFSRVSLEEKDKIIVDFNNLPTKDIQDAHLFGLVSRSAVVIGYHGNIGNTVNADSFIHFP